MRPRCAARSVRPLFWLARSAQTLLTICADGIADVAAGEWGVTGVNERGVADKQQKIINQFAVQKPPAPRNACRPWLEIVDGQVGAILWYCRK